MSPLSRHQPGLFLLALLIPGMFFLWRIGNLMPLYTNSATRESVRSALVRAADREGWLLSNVDVREVAADRVTLTYREHRRGPDTESCFILRLSDASLRPCDTGKN